VFRLRQQVGGEVPRVAFLRDDQNLGRSRNEVNPNLTGQEFLGGGYINVPRSDNPVGPRHRARSVCKGSYGLRAAHLKNPLNTH